MTDAEAAMRKHVRRLLADHGPLHLPVRLGAFFAWGTIRRVRLEATLLEGGLIPLPDGRFDILVREDRSPRRRRFTLAHEFGHLFFYRFAPLSKEAQRREGRHAPDEEERLCNIAAEEFLMPQSFIEATTDSIAWQDAARAVLAVSEDCDVSVEAAVLRLAPSFPGFGELRLWELWPNGWRVALARRFGAPRSSREFAERPESGLLNLDRLAANLEHLPFGQSRRWAAGETCAVRVPRRTRPTVLVAYRRRMAAITEHMRTG
ncbi:MAG: ImmA/IrrE family metallo-endopeptidase [Polyangiaceae bacterium]